MEHGMERGKEYYENGNLRYDGEFLDGKWNGKGKEYDQNGNIKYKGHFSMGNKIKKKKK